MRFRQSAPLPANPRMENLFEPAPFSRVFEDYGAKCLPIQAAITRKNPRPELARELLFNLVSATSACAA